MLDSIHDIQPMANYFDDGMDAARYARSRPNIHPTPIKMFRHFARPAAPFSLALDAGCGTGQSTVALAQIAVRVIGIDPSADMLKHAERSPNVEYHQARAEAVPLADAHFDLITAAQAYHWFKHDQFLAESRRLLRDGGWLLVYTSWFTGDMSGQPAFRDWFQGQYLRRYETPPRNRNPLTEELARKHGLLLRGQEDFSNEIAMSISRFTDYQLSTTNIIAAVRRGGASFDGAGRWIRESIEPLFGGYRERGFLFSGKTWYLQKAAV